MPDLPIPEMVEIRRRSVPTLSPGAPALDREQALEVLEQLKAALIELCRVDDSQWPLRVAAQGTTRDAEYLLGPSVKGP